MAEPEILWKPSAERIERSQLTRYQRWLADEKGLRFGSYDDLWRWSVDDLGAFWGSIVSFFDVRFSSEPERVLGDASMPGAEWFPGARVNYAEHIFREKASDDVAICHASEIRPLSSWTWGELRAQTAAIAAGLRGLGVAEGDRVVGLHAEHPGDARGVRGLRLDRGDLVLGRARVWRA
jgi:acetoacetyl-CoA synthetase